MRYTIDMLVAAAPYVVLVALIAYSVRTVIFIIGAARERQRRIPYTVPMPTPIPFISVVIPARNEEHTIAHCVHSLLASNYPQECFEIVVVNDRSTDRTGEVLQLLQRDIPNLVIHNTVDDNTNVNLQGKPRALHQGIMHSRGEYILMTDADCIVPPTWIPAIVQTFQNAHIGLIAAYTVPKGKRLFDYLQMHEWLLNNTMASAGV
ncbi:MAG: glycosyltransferase, partial [Candidatus Kapabacteria bacterium]|nr:glycosyltransferase [Candidatus Kapabacteria bacterium]